MAGLLDIFGAIKAGKEIANPASWKNGVNLTRSIFILLSVVAGIYRLVVGPLAISDDTLLGIAAGLSTVGLGVSNIITVVTTKKEVSLIGLPPVVTERETK